MEGLKFLMSAPSQSAVEDLFLEAYTNRNRPITKAEIKAVVEKFQISPNDAQELLESVHSVVVEAMYQSMSPQQIVEVLPAGLHQKLKVLIAKIITHHMPSWKQQSVQTQVSLPRLKGIDWRLYLRNASDNAPRVGGCSVIVSLKVEAPQENIADPIQIKNVIFELNRESLETMLEGLHQIRDKLAGIQ